MAEFLVLGAGMVGVSSALALQARGHQVTIVDRIGAGLETSYGNAGMIQVEAAEPYALPRDMVTLLKYAFEISNDVTWTLSGALQMAPALWSYFRHSSLEKHAKISHIHSQLTFRSTADHEPLIRDSESEHLISHCGLVMLHRDEREFEKAVKKAEFLRQEYGVTADIFDGKSYQQKEPALKKAPAGAVHYTQSWSCTSPGGLTKAYCDLFVKRGGRFVTGDASTLQHGVSSWKILTRDGELTAGQVVVALGPWSPELLKRFGYRIPMVYKRGYHGHFHAPNTLQRPFLDVANGVLAAPMCQGLRVTTGAALVPMKAAKNIKQLERGATALNEMIDLGKKVDEPQWSGTRPCMPDMLPLVGAAPNHKGLWFHFGHGHQGFTLGPTTAALLVQAMDGESHPLLEALSPAKRLMR
ncbi:MULTISPECIES: NAD(P)/FAD-dependent oxidoreductase [Marinomonas]|uniref:FAD-binding oxidoreductase n=1 Tax=Marinomonas arctica TaxID=383750 RepID=A0A7H1J8B8_9GAMM|nr:MULTISPECIES: FAD-dependent oxidoreductase [Marinomonas]MCS7486624.1 amino acid dehydrogenase [Marinomonas sp. BSi20414]QNT06734.1 FAD-binding oxidoreductase [Marinomonas arctica]GGN23125.1 oxidoreductase [Marinomonas arctica]